MGGERRREFERDVWNGGSDRTRAGGWMSAVGGYCVGFVALRCIALVLCFRRFG